MKHVLFVYAAYVLLYGIAWGAHRWWQRRGQARWEPLVLVACVGFGTLALSEPPRWFEDFRDAYYAAGAALLHGTGDARELYATGVDGFVCVPVLALVFVPFALLPPALASGVFAAFGAFAVFLTWSLLVRGLKLDRAAATWLAVAFALNGPLMNSVREGNVSHFCLLALAYAWIERARKPWRVGLVLGVAALFKLPLLLVGAYLVWTRNWRATVGMGLVLVGAGAVSLTLFGVLAHVTWYRTFVAGAGDSPIAAFNVQSLAALVSRAEGRGDWLCDWKAHALSNTGRHLWRAAAAFLYAGAGWAALRFRTQGAARREPWTDRTEFLLVPVLACVTSPLSWSHYYCWMLLPIAWALSRAARRGDRDERRFERASLVAAGLVSLPVVWPSCPPSGPLAPLYVAFVSHFLAGSLLWFGLLVGSGRAAGVSAAASDARLHD